jgi:hypothetical protein
MPSSSKMSLMTMCSTLAVQATHHREHSEAASENRRAAGEANKTRKAALEAHNVAQELSKTAKGENQKRFTEDAKHYIKVAGDFNVDGRKLGQCGDEHDLAAGKDFRTVQTSSNALSFRATAGESHSVDYYPPHTISAPLMSKKRAGLVIMNAQDAATKAQEYVQQHLPSSGSLKAGQDSGLHKPGKHDRDETNLGGGQAAKHLRSR